LRPGAVFRWIDFPPRFDEIVKSRWFVLLGTTGYFAQVALVHCATTTSQTEHYLPGGSREKKDHWKIQVKEIPLFEQDCILDFDEQPFSIPLSQLEEALSRGQIEEKGILPEDKIRMAYKRILRSEGYSRQILMDIHDSLNRIGISNLKKP
jgi:hypothetical protein